MTNEEVDRCRAVIASWLRRPLSEDWEDIVQEALCSRVRNPKRDLKFCLVDAFRKLYGDNRKKNKQKRMARDYAGELPDNLHTEPKLDELIDFRNELFAMALTIQRLRGFKAAREYLERAVG